MPAERPDADTDPDLPRASAPGQRVIVGISGGVDSSVAALRLVQAGYDVHGLFMTNWEQDEQGYCTNAEDLQDARRACDTLGIPLHEVNFCTEYRDRVFAHFLSEYQAGRTPNPDVLCNREIKFGEFLAYAKRLGARQIATGHYARVRHHDGHTQLLRGIDPGKDQSYFLHAVSQSALAQTLFPLGGLSKPQVRDMARAHGLHNHARADSTGICFIGERPFKEFLSTYLPAQPGLIQTPSGQTVGQHQGLMFYTLGQRQGLGIGGHPGRGEDAWYVVGKQLDANVLLVEQGHDNPAMRCQQVQATQLHWIGAPPRDGALCQARVRYRQPLQSCTVSLDGARISARFDLPQRAVTPGQYLVLYQDDICLGGGVITQTDAPYGQSSARYERRATGAIA